MEINIDAITSLPLWIPLPELDIKYWGMQSLSKIGSMLGFPLKIDKYTKEKSMLRYARLLVEMPLEGKQDNHRKEWRVKASVPSQDQNQPSKDAQLRGDDGYQLVMRHTTKHFVVRVEGHYENTALINMLHTNAYNVLLEGDETQERDEGVVKTPHG
ncbi:hypothetical protein Cgig2_022193 [Carnegiea gigantea]|uniref:DUF4283 domain-containing protein n=1 Tax=Carnegiea gigantea TaxID=171969 RepID=A0A9Q1GZ02_9CARY|nr:hypothetical protein Cgig2_022193 [Carnegiea gigantea]